MKAYGFMLQLCVALAFLFAGLILSTIAEQGVYANVGWVLAGLLFLLHPVSPVCWANVPRIKRSLRIAGAVVILLGLILRFGV